MPVVVNQNSVEQLYEFQVRPTSLTIFNTGIHHRLHIFRSHHQKCVARRRNALRYELRQEEQRTEWLKRKYIDSVRQQQQQQAISARVDSSTTRLMDHGQHGAEHKDQLAAEQKQGSCNSPAQVAVSSPQTVPDPNVIIPADLIKREQEECTSSPAKEDPDPPLLNKSTVHGPLKRRSSQSLKVDKASNWNSLNGTEDTRDELKLTAYDVIAGVISTPPIQPLEQDADMTCTNKSPSSSASKSGESHSATHSITPTTSAVTTTTALVASSTALTNKKKDQLALVKDLDEFSKVMHQVTQEQRAKERRRDSLASEMEPASYPSSQSHPAHLLSPSSPYLAMGQPCPLPSHQANKNYYQQRKYSSLQGPSTQVDSAYQPKTATKSAILPGLSSSVRSEPSSSAANHVPGTPTTPLEHFSAFHSPPPSHLPLASNQSPGAPCPPPPPYSSTSMCYTFGQESIHQSAASSPISDRWSLPSHPQQAAIQHSAVSDQPITMQENVKETILAHVSSRVVSLAGQKRAISSSGLPPPAKHPALPLLGRCPTNSAAAAACGSYSCPPPVPAPYPGPPPASVSVTFPHQSL